MVNILRTLCACALVAALAPGAFAQGLVAPNDAADLAPPGSVGVEAELVPLPTPTPENGVCYDNGPIANFFGTHPGGGDESVLQGDENIFGFGAQKSVENEMADDFILSNPCKLKGGVAYAYQTNAAAPTIDSVRVRIYIKDAGGNQIPVPDPDCHIKVRPAVALTNVYRVTVVGGDNARRLQRVEWAFAGDGCNLQPGVPYWIGLSYWGNAAFSGPWQPPVPRPPGHMACPPQHPINGQGAKQRIGLGAPFNTVLNGTCNVDIPFQLLGGQPPVCNVFYEGPVNATVTGGGGTQRRVRFTGIVLNTGTGVKRVSFTLFYNRKVNGQPGPPMGSRRFGPFNYGPGPTNFVINVPVPRGAPAGTYNWRLVLEDKTDTPIVCDERSGQVQLPPARIAGTGDEALADFVGDDAYVEFPDASATTVAPVSEVVVSPNPFTRQATLAFEVAADADVRLSVYDVLGREVAVLVDGYVEAGLHEAVFDGRGLAAGTYVYRLAVGNEVQTGRLTLTR
jgi:hypothetical protein